jgi:hypothetical protein
MNTARPESVPYQLFMLALCVYTLLALAAEVVLRPGGEIRLLLGYGDRYPVTPEGRFVAGFLMCAGVGLFGMFSGFLAAWFVAPAANQERGELEALKDEVRQLRAMSRSLVTHRAPPYQSSLVIIVAALG